MKTKFEKWCKENIDCEPLRYNSKREHCQDCQKAFEAGYMAAQEEEKEKRCENCGHCHQYRNRLQCDHPRSITAPIDISGDLCCKYFEPKTPLQNTTNKKEGE